ncbi:MAG TPA: hypothetical protein VGF67_33190 [Ktedonobacteraceae bacterium]|jgi:hypothetical protein
MLIFDNIEDLQIAGPFLPADGRGHTIFTARVHAPAGSAQFMEVQKMEPVFLRPGPPELADEAERNIASQIVQELDRLPLALDHAGAYIKETPWSLPAYLTLYQIRHADLLLVPLF